MKQDFGTTMKSTNYEACLTNTVTSKAASDQGQADTSATSYLKQDIPEVKYHSPTEDIQLVQETSHRKENVSPRRLRRPCFPQWVGENKRKQVVTFQEKKPAETKKG